MFCYILSFFWFYSSFAFFEFKKLINSQLAEETPTKINTNLTKGHTRFGEKNFTL